MWCCVGCVCVRGVVVYFMCVVCDMMCEIVWCTRVVCVCFVFLINVFVCVCYMCFVCVFMCDVLCAV